MKVTKKYLEKVAPSWQWKPKLIDFGKYTYIGKMDNREVYVESRASLDLTANGYDNEACTVRWYVYEENKQSLRLAEWLYYLDE